MPVDGNGDSVKVNMAEIYRVLLELRDEVKAANARLETHATLPLHAGGQVTVADHEARLRLIEGSLTPLAREAEQRFATFNQEICALEDKVQVLNTRVAWFAGGLATLITVLNLAQRYLT